MRTNAVKSSATEFNARIEPSEFEAWLSNIVEEAFESGYRLGKTEGK